MNGFAADSTTTPTYESITIGKTNASSVRIANGIISSYVYDSKSQNDQRRAALGVDNQGNGTLYLINNDLSQAHLYTQNAFDTGNDGITRLYYVSSSENASGTVTGYHKIAVLEDGIKYQADNYTDDSKTTKVTVKHQLNSTMDITGGADTDNLTDNNIGVVATAAVEDDEGNVTQNGKLEIKLAKNLQNLTSVQTVTTDSSGNVVNTTEQTGDGITITPKDADKISLTTNGLSNGGKQVTNMGSGINSTTNAYDIDTNGANIHDVKVIAASTASSGRTTLTSSDGSVSITDKGTDTVHSYDLSVDYSKMSGNFNLSYTGDNNSSGSNALSSAVAFKGTENQIVTAAENGKVTFKLADDVKGLTSVEAKTFNVAGDGSHSAITLSQGNVAMGGNKVTNVAAGTVSADSTDAVNGSQLYRTNEAISRIGGNINKLGTRINRGGAGAAALAALHPLDFDPDAKWDFAAGYGNYKDASAAAVGAYYRPDEDLMFSVGGSFGGGENMVNAGVSVKLGQGNHVSTSRVAMAKEIIALRDTVKKQDERIRKLETLVGGGMEVKEQKRPLLFPDVPSNHWAYEYVTNLHKAGILTGYPDGTFSGDRMMTRYEFAALVYRAIMAGAASHPELDKSGALDKLAKEFSSEMEYIRIDTISKDKNGNPDIERVRVNG